MPPPPHARFNGIHSHPSHLRKETTSLSRRNLPSTVAFLSTFLQESVPFTPGGSAPVVILCSSQIASWSLVSFQKVVQKASLSTQVFLAFSRCWHLYHRILWQGKLPGLSYISTGGVQPPHIIVTLPMLQKVVATKGLFHGKPEATNLDVAIECHIVLTCVK